MGSREGRLESGNAYSVLQSGVCGVCICVESYEGRKGISLGVVGEQTYGPLGMSTGGRGVFSTRV